MAPRGCRSGPRSSRKQSGAALRQWPGCAQGSQRVEERPQVAARGGSAVAEDILYWCTRPPEREPPDQAHAQQAARLYEAKDYRGALALLLKAAEAGSWYAPVAVDYQSEYGQGVPPNYVQSVAWYTKAANPGYVMAQFNLANMYLAGRGVVQDYAEALKGFQKAVDQHHVSAYYGPARMYEYGFGVRRDRQEAIELYAKGGARGALQPTGLPKYLKDPIHPDLPPDDSFYRRQAAVAANSAGLTGPPGCFQAMAPDNRRREAAVNLPARSTSP